MSNSFFLRKALVPAGLVATAAAGVLAFSLLGSGSSDTAAPQESPTSLSVALTSYEGKQPKGFSIDQVPAGWVVQAADAGKLVLAEKGADDQDPNVFEGKILVTVANQDELAVERENAKEIQVGDVDATSFDFAGGDATGLLVPAADRTLIFQLPKGLDWDEATTAEFAAGVHSTGTPEVTVG